MGIFHEGRVFHFFPGDWVDNCVGLVPLLPMVISEGNGHVGGFHSAEVILRQAAERELLGTSGHPRS
jgi:hypothetical protein